MSFELRSPGILLEPDTGVGGEAIGAGYNDPSTIILLGQSRQEGRSLALDSIDYYSSREELTRLMETPIAELEGSGDAQFDGGMNRIFNAWKKTTWLPEVAIDLTTDAKTFASLSPSRQEELKWLFVHRFDAEYEVARLMSVFVDNAPNPKVAAVLATQRYDEAQHVKAVVQVYEKVFGVEGGLLQVQKIAGQAGNVVADTMYDELDKNLRKLAETGDPDDFLRAVYAYHIISEGGVATTLQTLVKDRFKDYGRFPGLENGRRLVANDEKRHVAIGTKYCKHRVNQDLAAGSDHSIEVIGQALESIMAFGGQLVSSAEATNVAGEIKVSYGVEPGELMAQMIASIQNCNRRIFPQS